MAVTATRATRETLRKLPTTIRPVVDAADVIAPEGYEVEPVLVGLSGGARGNWKDLRQLLLAGQDALGAFAIVEQLGYALGLPELADPAFRVQAEKGKDQLLIQEYMLEMAPAAILLHEDA